MYPYPSLCTLAGRYLLCLALLLTGAGARAQDTTRLVMGYQEFPPYSFTDENGIPRGYSIDLMRHLTKGLGYQLEFRRSANPGEMLTLLSGGQIDVTSLLAVTEERQRLGSYTDPLGSFRTSLFVLSGSSAMAATDFSGARIGAVRGSFAVTAARRVPFATLVELPDPDAMIVPLLTGAVDAVVSSDETFLQRLREAGLDGRVRAIGPPLLESPRGFLVRDDRPEVLDALNAAIGARLANGEEALLHEAWFGVSKGFADHPHFFIALGLGGLACTIIVVLAFIALRSTARERRAQLEIRANKLLLDALNGLDAAIVIFDRDMKTVHWNDGFATTFPELIPLALRRATFRELIMKVQTSSIAGPIGRKDAEKVADEVIAGIQAGEHMARTISLKSGQVIEARDFPIGDDHYTAVRVDVTRLHDQAAEILRQQTDLKSANEKLQVFASVAAHDLRAPLNQQTSLLQFIEEDLEEAGLTLPAEIADNLRLIGDVSNRMKQLVTDLLEFARADADQGDAHRIAPAERLAGVIALAAVPGGFDIELAADLPDVTVPATAFDMVMRNLISNAIKHHDQDTGHVKIRGHAEDGCVIFEVEDDGPGIPERYRETIFEPFQRLSAGDRTEGSGLGLSFIQRTVESWGGEVGVFPADPRGSIFRVIIPNRRAGEIAAPAATLPPPAAPLSRLSA